MIALDEFLLAVVARRAAPAVQVVRELDSGIAVLIVALGIPLGFLINQIYYFLWDGMASSWPLLPTPLDRGREILVRLDASILRLIEERGRLEIDLTERTHRVDSRILLIGPRLRWLRLTNDGRSARRQYRDIRRRNWRAVRWLMLFTVDDEVRDVLRREYGGRADTYHALGGSRYAATTATLVCVLYNLIVHGGGIPRHPLGTLVIVVVWGAITGGAVSLLSRARESTLMTMQELLIDGLGSSVRVPLRQRRLRTHRPSPEACDDATG